MANIVAAFSIGAKYVLPQNISSSVLDLEMLSSVIDWPGVTP